VFIEALAEGFSKIPHQFDMVYEVKWFAKSSSPSVA